MRTIIQTIVAILALTVMAPGHAETNQSTVVDQVVQQAQDRFETLVGVLSSPIVDINLSSKDVDCLAKNIYYEAGGEPEEGKVAVAMVTINRVRDGRFGRSICSVVDQRTVTVRMREVTETRMVKTGYFGRPTPVKEKSVVSQSVEVCQFSWRCMFVKKPLDKDERWQTSRLVAERLLSGEYPAWQSKYSTALYFHNASVRPVWAKTKPYVARIGGHHFYSDNKI
jgi:spore germination cell wall hydrolase CwlJ-like protein